MTQHERTLTEPPKTDRTNTVRAKGMKELLASSGEAQKSRAVTTKPKAQKLIA